MKESYPWVEREIVHQPKLTLWQKALRDSLLEVGVRPFNGFTYDHVSGTKIGGTIFDRFGRRHTAAELLAYANPQKLRVLIYATVQKIVFDTSGTVMFVHSKCSTKFLFGVFFEDWKVNFFVFCFCWFWMQEQGLE